MPLTRMRRTKLSAADIQIGAVELKDAATATRATVGADGADIGVNVRSNTLASQATLDFARVALQLIDDIIGTIDTAFAGKVAVMGGKAESTVPTEVADADAVAVWMDTFGRLVQVFTDLATQTAMVTDASPAVMQTKSETGWVALDASAEETPVIDVRDYHNHTFGFIPSGLAAGESLAMIIWHSIDNTNWYPLESFTLDGDVAADALPSSRSIESFKTNYIKIELDTLVGTASVTPQYIGGN